MAKRKASPGEKGKAKETSRKEAEERALQERIRADLEEEILRFKMRQHLEEMSRQRRERERNEPQEVSESLPDLMELLWPPGSTKH